MLFSVTRELPSRALVLTAPIWIQMPISCTSLGRVWLLSRSCNLPKTLVSQPLGNCHSFVHNNLARGVFINKVGTGSIFAGVLV